MANINTAMFYKQKIVSKQRRFLKFFTSHSCTPSFFVWLLDFLSSSILVNNFETPFSKWFTCLMWRMTYNVRPLHLHREESIH